MAFTNLEKISLTETGSMVFLIFIEATVTVQDNFFMWLHDYAEKRITLFGMNYRFEKIVIFHCMNFRKRLTYNLRGTWHTLYAMLLSNFK